MGPMLVRRHLCRVRANGGPDALIQMVRNGSIETTQELMQDVDVSRQGGTAAIMVNSGTNSGNNGASVRVSYQL